MVQSAIGYYLKYLADNEDYLFILGLTGSIGSGKTEAANILAAKGIPIIDADQKGHELYGPGTDAQMSLVKIMGGSILSEHGNVNRSVLGKSIIEKPYLLEQVNNLLHPLIRNRIEEEINTLKNSGELTIAVQVPLLFQAKWEDLFDEIWAIETAENIAIARLVSNRGIDSKFAKNWISLQGDSKIFTEKADVVIRNEGTVSEFKLKVDKTWTERNPYRGKHD